MTVPRTSPTAKKASAKAKTAKQAMDFSTVVKFPTSQHLEALAMTSQSAARQHIEAGMELTAGNMEKVATHMMKNMTDMTSWNKDMFESYVTYCTTMTKGYEEISKTIMTSCQSMSQQYMQCCKDMLTAKTMKEAMDTQSEFVRSQMDTMMAEGTKISELCVKVASEASEPMQSQWSSMISKAA